MTDPAVVDTGPLVAIVRKREAAHDRCVAALKGFRAPLLTCWPVMTEAADPQESRDAKTTPNPREDRRIMPPDPTNETPARLTVHGEVVKTIADDLGIRVRNEEEVREFWDTHQVDSMLDWEGKGPPVFSIGRKEDKAGCRPGDEVSMTVVVQDRVNGKRGIRTVEFEVLKRG